MFAPAFVLLALRAVCRVVTAQVKACTFATDACSGGGVLAGPALFLYIRGNAGARLRKIFVGVPEGFYV